MKDTQRLNKWERQQQIAANTQRDTAATNRWLKSCGISEGDLSESKTLLLRAQKTAHELLAHHTDVMTAEEIVVLNQFAQRSTNSGQRQRITDSQCYAVLNLAKRINRRVFKQYKQLIKAQSGI